jgi:hypothetical protein
MLDAAGWGRIVPCGASCRIAASNPTQEHTAQKSPSCVVDREEAQDGTRVGTQHPCAAFTDQITVIRGTKELCDPHGIGVHDHGPAARGLRDLHRQSSDQRRRYWRCTRSLRRMAGGLFMEA